MKLTKNEKKTLRVGLNLMFLDINLEEMKDEKEMYKEYKQHRKNAIKIYKKLGL